MEDTERRTYEALKSLRSDERFQLWRDNTAKPLLEQLEARMKAAADIPEVELRATLKQYYTLKSLFYEWFDQAVLALELDNLANQQEQQ